MENNQKEINAINYIEEALIYLRKLERLDVFTRTGDVVPHPATDLLENFIENVNIIMNNLEKYQKALNYLGAIEIYQEENIYIKDYSEFDTIQEFIDLFSKLLSIYN